MVDSIFDVAPPRECDEHGVPLDWELCRTCDGGGGTEVNGVLMPRDCPTCGGHGSLKAAALAYLTTTCGAREEGVGAVCNRRPHEDRWHAEVRDGETWASWGGGEPHPVRHDPRCEGCGHPMSDGTWEDADPHLANTPEFERYVLEKLRAGQEPQHDLVGTHWSPCDTVCRHAGPQRVQNTLAESGWDLTPVASSEATVLARIGAIDRDWPVEASWRQAGVRTLGWPHDLRPQSLAILCLRCYAERTR